MTVDQLVTEFLAFAGYNWRDSIPEDVPGAWIEELSDIPTPLLQEALKRARGLVFPPNIGDVRRISEGIAESRMIRGDAPANRRLLDRGDKPPDWAPLTAEESAALFQKFRSTVAATDSENRVARAVPMFKQEANLRKLRQQAADLQRQFEQSKAKGEAG